MTGTSDRRGAGKRGQRIFANASVRILLGLLAGLTIGTVLADTRHEAAVLAIAQPVGQLWLDALTMTVVPLVTALLIAGIFEAGAQGGNAIARRTFVWFTGLLIGASLLGGGIALLLLDVWSIPDQAAQLIDRGTVPPVADSGNWLSGIIAPNILKAASDGAMVPLVLFALLFGFALTRVEDDLGQTVGRFFRGVAQVMLIIVGWILWLAPLGVLALAAGVGARLGVGVAGVLFHYVAVIIMVCLSIAMVLQLAAATVGGGGLARFARAVFPAQVIAMTTQSSLASLPAMMRAAEPLGISRASAGIVLPLAVSLFRAASAAANVGVAVYLAQLHGVSVTAETLVVGALVAAAVSTGAVGLPAQVSFFAVIAPVCVAMGVPIILLPLLLAIETIPDIFRTLGNVTADVAVMQLAARRGEDADVSPETGPAAVSSL